MLRPKRRDQIRDAIANEVTPTRSTSSDDLLLQLGPKQYAKLQRGGTTTPAGQFYFEHTETTPNTFDTLGTVVQRGSTEFLLSNGKARVLRRLAGDDYVYTRLGKLYFGAKQTQYLINVHDIIKKGALYLYGPLFHGSSQRLHAPRAADQLAALGCRAKAAAEGKCVVVQGGQF